MECPSSSVLGRPGFEMEDIAELGPNLGVNTSVGVEEEEDVDMNASWGLNNMTALYTEQNVAMDLEILQKIVPILVPVLFSIIIITGFIGNLLVVCVVALNKNMMNTTNLLILNLAVRAKYSFQSLNGKLARSTSLNKCSTLMYVPCLSVI